VANDATTIRERYGEKPITFLKTFDDQILFPKKIRKIFAQIWKKKKRRFIIKAPRGGGKSRILGALGFALWFFRDKDIVDMGGSLEQAKVVYNYFQDHCYMDPVILNSLPKEPQIQQTKNENEAVFKAVAASLKQIRGPHPDILFADEVCETKDEYVLAALPMVDTSPDPLIVMTSTFHKVFGVFQEIWDRAEELGYQRFSWDVFDVVTPFDPSIWNDKQLNREIPDLHKLKAKANGRTGDPEGWIPIDNVIQAWRERMSDDWFEVEYMGSRPSATGLINDPEDVDACTFEPTQETCYNYQKGAEIVIGIDWGFSSMTSVVELMRYHSNIAVQLDNKNYTQVRLETIVEDMIEKIKERGARFIYADSAGKFENDALRQAIKKANLPCKVIEVNFGKEKGDHTEHGMLGNYRAYFQRHLLRIPKNHQTAIWQHKRYRYKEGSDKPEKKDDHIPDATMCALLHWKLGRGDEKFKSHGGGEETKPITGGLRQKRF